MKILCLSNGHGEDIIAIKILEELKKHSSKLDIEALPLVGEGYAYSSSNIPIMGKVKQMPSGGFIYMDSHQLLRDVKGGLLKLTLDQYKSIIQWGRNIKKSQDQGLILAVGDIVPLLFAWRSGLNYTFVGTAKSEYYLRDDSQWLDKTSNFERWLGGVYLPWERWLMSRKQCKGVFTRDKLTTDILKKYSISAFDLGNPMMDGLEKCFNNNDNKINKDELNIVLLPGSRVPEIYQNWQLIFKGVDAILERFYERKVIFYSAIAPSINLDQLKELLIKENWILNNKNEENLRKIDKQGLIFTKKNGVIFITQNAYSTCLQKGQIAIAMAGTATEQFVGLGKPAIILIGKGPQFTPRFC